MYLIVLDNTLFKNRAREIDEAISQDRHSCRRHEASLAADEDNARLNSLFSYIVSLNI